MKMKYTCCFNKYADTAESTPPDNPITTETNRFNIHFEEEVFWTFFTNILSFFQFNNTY